MGVVCVNAERLYRVYGHGGGGGGVLMVTDHVRPRAVGWGEKGAIVFQILSIGGGGGRESEGVEDGEWGLMFLYTFSCRAICKVLGRKE
jgi:hypothetical protein